MPSIQIFLRDGVLTVEFDDIIYRRMVPDDENDEMFEKMVNSIKDIFVGRMSNV